MAYIQLGKENIRKFADYFGIDDCGFSNIPAKYSNIEINRFVNGELIGSYWCFPHGLDNYNDNGRNWKRNWKKYRKHQYRDYYSNIS